MSDFIVFFAMVAATAGVGMAIGIIVAGRMDRLMARRASDPAMTPTEPTPEPPADGPEPPAAFAPPQEEQS